MLNFRVSALRGLANLVPHPTSISARRCLTFVTCRYSQRTAGHRHWELWLTSASCFTMIWVCLALNKLKMSKKNSGLGWDSNPGPVDLNATALTTGLAATANAPLVTAAGSFD